MRLDRKNKIDVTISGSVEDPRGRAEGCLRHLVRGGWFAPLLPLRRPAGRPVPPQGGVVDAFNVAHPAEAVATGDQIVTVNGEAASAEVRRTGGGSAGGSTSRRHTLHGLAVHRLASLVHIYFILRGLRV